MNTSPICDYVTLYMGDAAGSNYIYSWNVPPNSYYNKDKGLMCFVSLVQADAELVETNGLVISTDLGQNHLIAEQGAANKLNNAYSSLAVLNMNAAGELSYYSPEPIKLLAPANPQTIRLAFNSAETTKDKVTMTDGVFVLKFEYLIPEVSKELSYDAEYKPAFPEHKNF
jgi:hypothetical protein